MDRTPQGKQRRLSCRNGNREKLEEPRPGSPVISRCTSPVTPIQESKRVMEDYSPLYLLRGQLPSEEVDVVWDYNSPQMKQQPRVERRQKRLLLPQSPKPRLKKHPSNNQIQNIDHIKEQMEALRKQVLSLDDDSFENGKEEEETSKENEEPCMDFLNDSLDEQMFLCTAEIENKILASQSSEETNESTINTGFRFKRLGADCIRNLNNLIDNNNTIKDTNSNTTSSASSCNKMDVPKENENKRCANTSNCDLFDSDSDNVGVGNDSFESALAAFKEDSMDLMLHHDTNKTNTNSLQLSTTPIKNNGSYLVEKYLGKKTEISPQNGSINNNEQKTPPQSVLEEVERKRQEAIAKLQKRQKLSHNEPEVTRNKNDEVERNRLEALAKLETKKKQMSLTNSHKFEVNTSKWMQEEVERKRLEALAKLEAKKKLNASRLNGLNTTQNGLNSSYVVPQAAQNNVQIKTTSEVPESVQIEIERKRLEALAKLEAKRKLNSTIITQINQTATTTTTILKVETSPVECMPDEVEQKRRQALAKLEARKKQEIIERNRLEALKRLEQNKMRRALQMKSSLPRRTDYT